MKYKKVAVQMAKDNNSADMIYRELASIAGLFGNAFFGFRSTRQERAKLHYLWNLSFSVAHQSEYHFGNDGQCDNVEFLPNGERKFSKI